jgi:gamma-glutamyltranspeptidase/glutathione hydrolase
MRFKSQSYGPSRAKIKPNRVRRWRQIALLGAVLLLGCSTRDPNTDPDAEIGDVGYVQGFLGGVITDEPRAALIGRNILSAGGTATDAAVGVAFALSVTYPSSAGLGGGGICVVHDHATNKTEALDFLAPLPSAANAAASRPAAVPTMARGFYALHSRFGRLRWPQVLAPAEELARLGHVVTRAFAVDLQAAGPALLQDMESRRVFINPAGNGPLGEGGRLTQVDLAAVLANLRRQGPAELYTGPLAAQFVAAANQAGGALTLDDLRAFTPEWRPTVGLRLGNQTFHFAPPPAAAGVVEAEMIALLLGRDRYDDAKPEEKIHLLAEAGKRAFADRERWYTGPSIQASPGDLLSSDRLAGLMATYRQDAATPSANLGLSGDPRPENPAATSFVVLDREGSAVVCGLTMNNLFGTGRIASGTGILIAAAPGAYAGGPISLGPMLLVNHNNNRVYAAGAATGGVTAPTALVQTLMSVAIDKRTVEDALRARRVHNGGRPDVTYVEQGMSEADLRNLTARGHQVAATPVLGRVNFAFCPQGIPSDNIVQVDICQMRADPSPRGFGIAASAD